jgi:tetratricopeptide (TPR) repeat protein
MSEAAEFELRRRVRDDKAALAQTRNAIDEASVRKRGILLFSIGSDLIELGEDEEAIVHFEEADEILWRMKLEVPAIFGRSQRGAALMQLGRDEEALEVFTSLIDKVGVRASAPHVPEMMTLSVRMQLLLLDRLGYIDEAAAAADRAIRELDPSAKATSRQIVAEAFRIRGGVARIRGDNETALLALSDGLRLCEGIDDNQLDVVQARMLVARAEVLAEEGRREEALATCEAVLARFGSAPTEVTEFSVADARKLKDALTPLS